MRLVDEQREANQSTLPWFADYKGHREHTTALVVKDVPKDSKLRVCILGAGNCYDLDLLTLSEHFAEIHLVDIDKDAIEAARARQLPAVQARLVLRAPVDLTGFLDKLERWKRLEVTEGELLSHAERASKWLASLLGSYDLVVSACVVTQMQLSVLNGLGDEHQLFDAVRHSLGLLHLLTLYELTRPGGRALLITDVLSEKNYRYLAQVPETADFKELLNDVMGADRVIYVARPGFLHLLARQDDVLSKNAKLSAPITAWLWQNGPNARFLVYAMSLERLV